MNPKRINSARLKFKMWRRWESHRERESNRAPVGEKCCHGGFEMKSLLWQWCFDSFASAWCEQWEISSIFILDEPPLRKHLKVLWLSRQRWGAWMVEKFPFFKVLDDKIFDLIWIWRDVHIYDIILKFYKIYNAMNQKNFDLLFIS